MSIRRENVKQGKVQTLIVQDQTESHLPKFVEAFSQQSLVRKKLPKLQQLSKVPG